MEFIFVCLCHERHPGLTHARFTLSCSLLSSSHPALICISNAPPPLVSLVWRGGGEEQLRIGLIFHVRRSEFGDRARTERSKNKKPFTSVSPSSHPSPRLVKDDSMKELERDPPSAGRQTGRKKFSRSLLPSLPELPCHD